MPAPKESARRRARKTRQLLRTFADYALDSSEAYFDQQIQNPRNSRSWVRDCAAILADARAELRRRTFR